MTSPYTKTQLTPIGGHSRPRTTLAAVDAHNSRGLVSSPQQRPFTSQSSQLLLSSKITSKNAISFADKELVVSSSSTTLANLSPAIAISRRPLRKMSSFITTATADSDSENIGDMDLLDDDFDGTRNKKQTKTREFFRTCSLCEVKFPRHAVDKKILRKHIIELR